MFRSHLLITLRTFTKHTLFSFVNILGLAMGVAACLLIILWVIDELSYDRYHKDAQRVYRVMGYFKVDESTYAGPSVSSPLKEVLQNDFPEVEQAARFRGLAESLFNVEGQSSVNISNTSYADGELFEVLDIPFIYGDSSTALSGPRKMVLSESTAKLFFGNENPVGKVLKRNNEEAHEITGVYKDFPENSHYRPNMLISLETQEWTKNAGWFSFNFYVYMKLKEGADIELMNHKIQQVVEQHFKPEIKEGFHMEWDDFIAAGNYVRMHLQPLTDIHLHGQGEAELMENGNIAHVYLFCMIAFMILLIACFNYMNLTTAKASYRAKEVGVKKVLGANRSQLIKQFLLESLLITVFAFVLGLIIAELSIPLFNYLAVKNISIPYDLPLFWGCLLIGITIITVLAGLYPSFIMSNFRPISSFKGRLGGNVDHFSLRRSLVLFQFSISLILVISTLIIHQQIQYIRQKDLGFNPEQVLVLNDTHTLGDKVYTLRDELSILPEVSSITVSDYLPVNGIQNNRVFWPKGEQNESLSTVMEFWEIDPDFIETFGLNILEGRNFSKEIASDSLAIILNETAVAQFGLSDPVGKYMQTYGEDTVLSLQIIGVLKDVHFQSFQYQIEAMGLLFNPSIGRISMKINATDYANTLSKIETLWKDFAPFQAINYQFMDERFEQFYKSEKRLSNILFTFSIIAILIASLGLLALSAYMVEKRAKEMSIRKVLGATIAQLIQLLSKDYAILMFIAWIIAIPISLIGLDYWLSQYSYHISLAETAPSIIFGVGLAGLCVSLSIICIQALSTARKDPVLLLREE